MHIPAADRGLAFLGYVPFLFWVPVVFRRDSMFCQFHGRQSGVLWGLWIIPTALLMVAFFFLQSGDLGLMQFIFFGAIMVISIVYLLMCLIGMVKSLLRERYRMPVVADVALLLRL
jgi:uncharacterized membrane protein